MLDDSTEKKQSPENQDGSPAENGSPMDLSDLKARIEATGIATSDSRDSGDAPSSDTPEIPGSETEPNDSGAGRFEEPDESDFGDAAPAQEPDDQPPVTEVRDGGWFWLKKDIQKRGLIIGVGGTGTGIIDLATRSDERRLKLTGRHGTYTGFIPGTYHTLNIDLSDELNELRDTNLYARDGLKADYARLAALSTGAAKIPPIGSFVARQMYDYLATRGVTRLEAVRGQIAFIVHSHTGGTGSGFAPTLASMLTQPSNGQPPRTVGTISIGITHSDNWPANRIYNFGRICERSDLAVIIDQDTVCGFTVPIGNASISWEDGSRPTRTQTADYYARTTVTPALGGEVPRFISAETHHTADQLAVADRMASRLLRMMAAYCEGKNPGNWITMMNRGDRYREGKARWALPYVWPVDGDIDTMIDRDVRLGTLVTRALIDGSLCASSSVPGTAESAIILYECPRGMERSLRPATATEAVMKITGIPKERILTLSVSPESNHDLVNEGVSVAVLLVAEIPQFVEQWLEHFTHEKGFRNTLKDTVEKTWSSPGNDAREESSDDVDVPIADYQTRAWDEVKNAMLDFRNQPGIDKAAATFSETKLEDDLADLSKRIAATDIWAEFDSFADRAGIYDYLPRPSTDDSVSS